MTAALSPPHFQTSSLPPPSSTTASLHSRCHHTPRAACLLLVLSLTCFSFASPSLGADAFMPTTPPPQAAVIMPRSPLNRVRGGGEITGATTSDGKRRLINIKELFSLPPEEGLEGQSGGGSSSNEKSGSSSKVEGEKNGVESLPTMSVVHSSPDLMSREGLLRMLGYATAVYFGKQFFNGGRYDEMPDLKGQIAVITGGNTGIGKETAIRLAQMGAQVVIACRNPERAEKAVQEIKSRVERERLSMRGGPVPISWVGLDLSDLRSIDRFNQEIRQRVPRIDLLINNAGVMAVPERQLTKDGFEMHLGINHLGHFYLTNRVFDMLLRSPHPRIISVSSEAHRFGKIRLQDLNYDQVEYNKWEAYGQSKLANVLFTKELHRRLEQQGLGQAVLAVSCHPGLVRTELGRYLTEEVPKSVLGLFGALGWYFTKSPKQGAQTQLYLAASPRIWDINYDRGGPGGMYFSDCKPKTPSSDGQDMALADALWRKSEDLTGAKFPVLIDPRVQYS